MSDFLKELEGKAYALVSGTIDLDEFKSWYQLSMAMKSGPVPIAATQTQAQPIPVRNLDTGRPVITAEDPEDDYRPSEAHLDSMDQPDPDWAVGTGDQLRKQGRLPQ